MSAQRPWSVHRLVRLLTLLGLLLASATAASAVGGTVVARGLANPRGLVVASDGTLYVSEAGSGGSDTFNGPPNFGPGPSHRGTSARVSRIGADGTATLVAGNLPSLALGGYEVIGPSTLVEVDGDLLVVTGYVHQAMAAAPNEAAVLRINRTTGAVTLVSDIGAFERANDPDGFGIESDLNGIAASADGAVYVGDAGGNALYRVDPRSGQLSLVTVFDGLPGAGPNPARGNRNELDPVPTGVAMAADGSVYVGFLSGFPFPTGAAKVVRVARDGAVSDALTGLTAVVGVAVGPDGLLYVVEFASGFDLNAQPPGWKNDSGRVLRVLPTGATQVVADGLNRPYGIAFDKTGNLFVTNHSDAPPEAGAQGEVVRFTAVAPPAVQVALPATGGDAGMRERLLILLAGLALACSGLLVRGRRQAQRRS